MQHVVPYICVLKPYATRGVGNSTQSKDGFKDCSDKGQFGRMSGQNP